MSSGYDPSTEDYTNINFEYSDDVKKKINDMIINSINQDLDQSFPDSINSNNTQINHNYQSQSNVIRLNLPKQSQNQNQESDPLNNIGTIITQNYSYDSSQRYQITLPLKQINPKRVESKLKKSHFQFSKEFDPNFWKYFYDENEPFFNYDYGNDLQTMTVKEIIQGNTGFIPIYEGQVNLKGEKHGLGKLIIGNKSWQGGWRFGQFTGWGREVDENNEIYEGKYVNGKLYGKGIYTDGQIYYVGEFRDKKMIGYGEIFTDEYHYSGQIWNKVPDGKGIIHIYKKGTYEGDFENGIIEGNGVFKFNNGDCYIGEMKNGKMDGKGKLVHRNNGIEKGIFRNGNLVKRVDNYEDEKDEFS